MKRVEINKYIVADPEICHGKLTFNGTRVMVWQVLSMLARGETTKDVLQAFPSLAPKHIQAALDYAGQIVREGIFIPQGTYEALI